MSIFVNINNLIHIRDMSKALKTVIGIDFGCTNIRVGRIEGDKVLESVKISTPKDATHYLDTVEIIIEAIKSVWTDEVCGIGIGVPSVVDRVEGVVYNVMNIPHWDKVPLKQILNSYFHIPVYVDNDANCFALGERIFGEGQHYQNFVGLTIGTGLGGGIIQRGKLLEDANCGSGEFGMLPYKDNILEYYCSGSYFMNVWGVDGQEMYTRALNKDPEALEAYKKLGIYIADAIKMVVLTIDPEMIVFGGSVADTHKLFEESMHEHLKNFAYQNSIKKLKILFSSIDNPGLLGAASLCY